MLTIDPTQIAPSKMHAYLQGAVIPRPIAFASTIDTEGHVNLSPFSFFNVFSGNPPILVFSPARRGRDNTTKHTYQNIVSVPEVVIHVVSYSMVEQMSLTSCEFPSGVNEFVKAGFTEVPSVCVKPPRVKESPIAMECKVNQVIELGQQGGAGNLVICEVVLMHINEEVLDAQGRIDPYRLDAVARLGGDYYARVSHDTIFAVAKPSDKLGLGFDQLPVQVRHSKVLTGNDLGRLASCEHLPTTKEVKDFRDRADVRQALEHGEHSLHVLAQQYLRQGKTIDAWKVLLAIP